MLTGAKCDPTPGKGAASWLPVIRPTSCPGDLVDAFFLEDLIVPQVCERIGCQWVASALRLDTSVAGK